MLIPAVEVPRAAMVSLAFSWRIPLVDIVVIPSRNPLLAKKLVPLIRNRMLVIAAVVPEETENVHM